MNVNRLKRVPPLLIVAMKPPGRYVQYEEAIHRCLQDLWEMGIPGYPNSWMVHGKTHRKWIIHKQFTEINHPAILVVFFKRKITHGYPPVDPWFSQLFGHQESSRTSWQLAKSSWSPGISVRVECPEPIHDVL